MLSEKPWKVESVLLLGLGMMVSLSAAVFVVVALNHFLPEQVQRDQNFYSFIVHTTSMHGVGLILVTLFLRQHDVSWPKFLGMQEGRLAGAVAWGILTGLIVLPIALGLNRLAQYLISLTDVTPQMQVPVQILQTNIALSRRILFALAAIVFAPVVEEALFRGILYPLIKRRGFPRLALWGTSLLFAAIHANLMTFIPLTFFALVLVRLYEKTDNLIAPIMAHATFNAANFVILIYPTEANQVWEQLFPPGWWQRLLN